MGEPRDLFSVFVDGVIDKGSEIEKVREIAKGKSASKILARAESGNDVVALVVEESLRASAERISAQARLVRSQVRAEGTATARTDIRKLKPITDVDIAARAAVRVSEVSGVES